MNLLIVHHSLHVYCVALHTCGVWTSVVYPGGELTLSGSNDDIFPQPTGS